MYTFLPRNPPIKKYRTQRVSLLKISDIASRLPKLLLTNKVQTSINKYE